MEEKDKKKSTWTLKLEDRVRSAGHSFGGVETVGELVKKFSTSLNATEGNSVEETIKTDLQVLQDIMNSDMAEVPDEVKGAILDLFQDIIHVTTNGKASMVYKKRDS